jgi:arabinofuranosyltransferase
MSCGVSRTLRVLGPWLGGAVVVALTVWGWRTFFFLTDDAHIEFRYVSNLLAGRGLTWNPAPFQPVEGYTSLLWVLVLAAVWAVTGIEPPQSAGVLSLCCGLLTLGIFWWLVRSVRLPAAWASRRWLLTTALFAGTLSNRTFLTWLSSGLEAALFNLTFTAWFAACFALSRRGVREGSLKWVSLAAAVMALTRPDGLLAIGATLVLAFWLGLRRLQPWRRLIIGTTPLLLVAIHVLWRKWVYGFWLPNTYYAKHVAPWPESGARYLFAFVLEYGLWVWLAAALVFTVLALLRWRQNWATVTGESLPTTAAISVLVVHALYYCFIIGGDHFEFRVLSHLVPFLWLSGGWLVARLSSRVLPGVAVLLLWFAVSLPIPWMHWSLTRSLNTRQETFGLKTPVAASLPAFLSPLTSRWDETEAWLIDHSVGVRHQEHKAFYGLLLSLFPKRSEGARFTWEAGHPINVQKCVGVVGWVFPNVAILDELGLNDAVIARTPSPYAPEKRQMAHDRAPSPGYFGCFRPNFFASKAPVLSTESSVTGEQIELCEFAYGHPAPALREKVLTRLRTADTAPPQDVVQVFQQVTQLAVRVPREALAPLYARQLRSITFDSGESPNGVTFSGEAFGTGPTHGALPAQQMIHGGSGDGLLNSYHGQDASLGEVSVPLGTLQAGASVSFFVGGSNECLTEFVSVEVDGVELQRACGQADETLRPVVVPLTRGGEVTLRAVDASGAAWAHILVDDVRVFR